jgi:hypothetical protein
MQPLWVSVDQRVENVVLRGDFLDGRLQLNSFQGVKPTEDQWVLHLLDEAGADHLLQHAEGT